MFFITVRECARFRASLILYFTILINKIMIVSISCNQTQHHVDFKHAVNLINVMKSNLCVHRCSHSQEKKNINGTNWGFF